MNLRMYQNYWWLIPGLLAGPLILLLFPGIKQNGSMVVSAFSGVLGLCYFVQRQKLEETRLFKELFEKFNSRYDDVNQELERIAQSNTISADDRAIVVDYFNICAEEYLYFKQGYIYQSAWRAWCRGMAFWLSNPVIREVWEQEFETESYYGLSITVIEEAARKRVAVCSLDRHEEDQPSREIDTLTHV